MRPCENTSYVHLRRAVLSWTGCRHLVFARPPGVRFLVPEPVTRWRTLVMTFINMEGFVVVRSTVHGLVMICALLSSCSRDPMDADALGSVRKNIMVSSNSAGLLEGTRGTEITRVSFYLVNGFYDKCTKANMALELGNKTEISEFIVLLHKNAEGPRLRVDKRRRYDMVVATYGTNEAMADSVIYISRGHEDMIAWYEVYVKKGETLSWDICGGGKTVNELERWIEKKNIHIWHK